MGFFLVEGTNDETGDGPADIVENQLSLFRIGAPGLSFQYFLDSLAAALRDEGTLVVSDPERITADVRLAAQFAEEAEPCLSGVAADSDLKSTLASALFRIGDEYETFVGRMPRTSEILATFVFALAGDCTRFFADVAGRDLKSITLA